MHTVQDRDRQYTDCVSERDGRSSRQGVQHCSRTETDAILTVCQRGTGAVADRVFSTAAGQRQTVILTGIVIVLNCLLVLLFPLVQTKQYDGIVPRCSCSISGTQILFRLCLSLNTYEAVSVLGSNA
jgi:hypothetical protein